MSPDEREWIEVACPHCGVVQPFHAWQGANAARFAELVPSVVDGTFMRAPCTGCGRAFAVERPLLWTGPRYTWFIAVYARADLERLDELVARAEQAFSAAIAPAPVAVQIGLRAAFRRVVFGYDELREKVLCDVHGIDDRDLEVLKIALLQEHPEWCDVAGMTGLVLAAVEHPPGTVCFRFADAADPQLSVTIPRDALRRVEDTRMDWSTTIAFPGVYVHLSQCTPLL